VYVQQNMWYYRGNKRVLCTYSRICDLIEGKSEYGIRSSRTCDLIEGTNDYCVCSKICDLIKTNSFVTHLNEVSN